VTTPPEVEVVELIIERALPVDPITNGRGDGYTVEGLAVPYGRPQRVSDDGGRTTYREGFAPGSFARDVARAGSWVNLFVGHRGDEGDRYLGRCVGLTEQADGLHAEFRLNRSHPEVEAARAGELTGWSVSAHVYRSREGTDADGPVVWRELCGLSHVAATASPQYDGAGVLVAREHVIVPVAATRPRLAALRAAGYGRRSA
jgi:HK97 family phage prohead protease